MNTYSTSLPIKNGALSQGGNAREYMLSPMVGALERRFGPQRHNEYRERSIGQYVGIAAIAALGVLAVFEGIDRVNSHMRDPASLSHKLATGSAVVLPVEPDVAGVPINTDSTYSTK